MLDEAHERNLNTDILIGLLSRVIPLRLRVAAQDRTALARVMEGLLQFVQEPKVWSPTVRTREKRQTPALSGTRAHRN